jgi:hypothetical protein
VTLISPVELSDGELDIVAAGCGGGNGCNGGNNGRNDGGTTVQVGILSAQADDDSNAALIAVGNQST